MIEAASKRPNQVAKETCFVLLRGHHSEALWLIAIILKVKAKFPS